MHYKPNSNLFTSNKGFTLMELLVVLVVIGILSAMSMLTYKEYRSMAYDGSAQSFIHDARTALEAGKIDNPNLGFVFAWTNTQGPITSFDGVNFAPGLMNPRNFQSSVWFDGDCEAGLWGNACAVEGIFVSVCKAGLSRSWMRWRDGSVFSFAWRGNSWC